MNIAQLKELIKDLPDEMPVVECREGNVGSWTEEPNISIGTVYKFYHTQEWGVDKGNKYLVEFSRIYKAGENEIISSYPALIFYTKE